MNDPGEGEEYVEHGNADRKHIEKELSGKMKTLSVWPKWCEV